MTRVTQKAKPASAPHKYIQITGQKIQGQYTNTKQNNRNTILRAAWNGFICKIGTGTVCCSKENVKRVTVRIDGGCRDI